jgi:hypothetical protein
MINSKNVKDADPRNYCPLWPDVQSFKVAANHLERSLKDLRKKMDACDLCIHKDSCPIIHDLVNTISQVVYELNVEAGIIQPK